MSLVRSPDKKVETPRASLDVLYREFAPVLVSLAYRITGDVPASEDLCQEAFVLYHERVEALPFDEAKYWLLRVLKNLAFGYEKRKGRERKVNERYSSDPSYGKGAAGGADAALLAAEEKKTVQELLLKIPFKSRVPLILKEYAGFSYKEIAETMGVSTGNVRVRIFRVRKFLEKMLQKEGIG